MKDTGYISVICYPQVSGSKNGSKPVEQAVVRDTVTGKEWEYDIPVWMQNMSREHVKERVMDWWKNDQEDRGMDVDSLVGRVVVSSD